MLRLTSKFAKVSPSKVFDIWYGTSTNESSFIDLSSPSTFVWMHIWEFPYSAHTPSEPYVFAGCLPIWGNRCLMLLYPFIQHLLILFRECLCQWASSPTSTHFDQQIELHRHCDGPHSAGNSMQLWVPQRNAWFLLQCTHVRNKAAPG